MCHFMVLKLHACDINVASILLASYARHVGHCGYLVRFRRQNDFLVHQKKFTGEVSLSCVMSFLLLN